MNCRHVYLSDYVETLGLFIEHPAPGVSDKRPVPFTYWPVAYNPPKSSEKRGIDEYGPRLSIGCDIYTELKQLGLTNRKVSWPSAPLAHVECAWSIAS